mgnify:CR=1 FL=1
MNIIKGLFLLFTTLSSNAQTDTLYANQTHNLALFFPSPIRQATPGSENFTFSYNRDTPQHFGLLQASPGTNSNLLVITNDGHVYSFTLQYSKGMLRTNRFIGLDESIGHERPIVKIAKSELIQDLMMPETQKKTSHFRKADYFENLCSSLMLKNTQNLKSKKKGGMTLRLQNMVYHNREVYLVLEIANKSGIDFEVDYLKVFKVNGNKRRKSSFQKLQLIPVYAHNHPSMVNDLSKKRFVYVVPKFTFGDSENLQFELKEKKGSRMMDIRYKF